MKDKFFVVFCQQAQFQPKMYLRHAWALKKMAESSTYSLKSFEEEEEANRFLAQKVRDETNNKRVSALQTLKTNLQIKPNTPPTDSQHESKLVFSQNNLNQNQKQQRGRQLNMLLEENKIFKKSKFMPSDMLIDSSLFYEGFFDGCCKGNPGQAGIGYIINNASSQKLTMRSEYIGNRTNNQAEMLALILLLGDAYCNGIKNLNVYGDSSLVIRAMSNLCQISSPYLVFYFATARTLQNKFTAITFNHINRTLNYQADALANKSCSKSSL